MLANSRQFLLKRNMFSNKYQIISFLNLQLTVVREFWDGSSIMSAEGRIFGPNGPCCRSLSVFLIPLSVFQLIMSDFC